MPDLQQYLEKMLCSSISYVCVNLLKPNFIQLKIQMSLFWHTCWSTNSLLGWWHTLKRWDKSIFYCKIFFFFIFNIKFFQNFSLWWFKLKVRWMNWNFQIFAQELINWNQSWQLNLLILASLTHSSRCINIYREFNSQRLLTKDSHQAW